MVMSVALLSILLLQPAFAVTPLVSTATSTEQVTQTVYDEDGVQHVIIALPPPVSDDMQLASTGGVTTRSPHLMSDEQLAAASLGDDLEVASSNTDSTDPLKPIERDDLELLLLEMRLNDLVLVEDIPAYLNSSSIVMPLRDFSQILEFAIDVEPLAGTASGWFVRENNLFSLNISRGEVIISGKVTSFDARLVEIHEDDIYVDIRLLSRWFPIDIRFDLSNLMARLTSRELLPIEQKMARSDFHAIALSRGGATENNYPEVDIPHKLISVPVVDVDLETSYLKNGDDDGPGTANTEHSITMTGDLLYSNAQIYIAGSNEDKFDTLRLRLERKDENGNAVGELPWGLQINEAQVGDVVMPQLSEITRSELGRGLLISNMPLDTPSEFDTVTLDGDLPLGWDLELYRNEVLIDFAASQTNGRYTFEDVPLLFGVNVVRLVFYGPQGQEREEIRHFRVGPSQVQPGEVHYRFVTNQHDRPFLVRDDSASENLEGERRILVEASTGINRNLSLGGNYVELPFDDGAERYASVFGVTSFGNVFTRLNLIKQLDNGWAASLNGQTSAFGINLIGEHSHYRNYFSEQVSDSTDPLSSNSSLRLEGSIPETLLPRIPYSFTLSHDRFASGDTSSTLSNRSSMAISNASITNTLSYSSTTSDEDSTNSMSGSLLLGGRYQAVRMSGSVAYAAIPSTSIQSANLSGSWRIADEYQANSGVTHTFAETGDSTEYSAGLSMQTDYAALGVNLDYISPTDMEARLSVSYALGHNPDTGEVVIENHGIAESGLIGARVFLDMDVNGIYTDGDELLQNVGFKADGGIVKTKTDKHGGALITGLAVYRAVDLEIDNGTLEDPFWVADPAGVRITPRPGSFGTIDFPIVMTGEIDGTAYRKWSDKTDEAAGVYVQLIDEDGNLVREIRSAYDGFFLFDFVPPGAYTLRISPDQLSSLGLQTDDEHAIEIGGDGTIVSGMKFMLISDPA
jgi:hypothetical protein